jgi:16S rRNA (cytosine1402-N4)-methyltransferase
VKILKHNLATHNTYHLTVLKQESIDALQIKDNGIYVDATFGGGGHTRAILEANPTCKVIAFDWDKEALEHNGHTMMEEFGDRLIVEYGNFAHCYKLLKKNKIKKVDGVLADFGTSQHQIVNEDGFSFSKDTPLDMRMSKGHHYFDAYYVVNKFTQKQIADIIFQYGQDLASRKIAAAIVKEREKAPLATTKQLAKCIERAVTFKGHQKTHPATRTFQALRIFVNKELENIELFLKNITPFIKKGGHLGCISFHSLEDGLVKDFFRDNEEKYKAVTRKPITASEEECAANRSSRSAKLRVGEKLV